MTESFSPNASPYSTNAAGFVTGASQPGAGAGTSLHSQEAEQFDFRPCDERTERGDWQPHESDLLPGFGVERARELLVWLINLEIRLPPYAEVSPA